MLLFFVLTLLNCYHTSAVYSPFVCETVYVFDQVCKYFIFQNECQPWSLDKCQVAFVRAADSRCPKYFCVSIILNVSQICLIFIIWLVAQSKNRNKYINYYQKRILYQLYVGGGSCPWILNWFWSVHQLALFNRKIWIIKFWPLVETLTNICII